MKNMLQNCWEGCKAFGNAIKEVAVEATSKVKTLVGGAVAGGVSLLGGGKAHAQASAYVEQMETASDQMVVDLGAAIPIALAVAIVSVGVFIVWKIFKRLANG